MRRTIYSCLACVVLVLAGTQVSAQAQPSSAGQRSAKDVVSSYFAVINSMLAGASANGLASVYAPDAILTLSTPVGVTKTVVGLPALTNWYSAWSKKNAGSHFARTSMITPLPGMVVSYDYTSSLARPLIGRCAHTFSVRDGKIVTDDWVVYFITR